MVKILWIALTLSLLGNALLIYRVFDIGVAMTYGSDELHRRETQLSNMQLLLPYLIDTSTGPTIRSAAKAAGLEVLDKGTDGLYVGEIHFIFMGDTLSAVKFY